MTVVPDLMPCRSVTAGFVADMRSLPLPDGVAGFLLAFYSLIHIRRSEVGSVPAEFQRVLRAEGHLLLAAHEGDGEIAVAGVRLYLEARRVAGDP